jgi:hypothetical protein
MDGLSKHDSSDPHGPGTPAWELCDELASAVRLLIQGAQEEITARHGVEQPKAGEMVLITVINEVDDHLDLPGEIYNPFVDEVRRSLER